MSSLASLSVSVVDRYKQDNNPAHPVRAAMKRQRLLRRNSARAVAPAGVAFADRLADQCAWIVGEATHLARCCGAPIEEGAQLRFCPEHLARAFSKSSVAQHEVDQDGQPINRRYHNIGRKPLQFRPRESE